MTLQAKIAALRAALERIADHDGADHSQWKIAREVLALTADDAEQAPESCVVEGSEGRELCKGSCAESGICTWKAAPVADTGAVKRRDIFAICDAYESGMGHGLQLDGHKSGAIFGNPEHGKAYEIGYELGEERARDGKKAAPTTPTATADSAADSPVDYRFLLTKYIDHVGHEEGITFVSRFYEEDGVFHGGGDQTLTADEMKALLQCEQEANSLSAIDAAMHPTTGGK